MNEQCKCLHECTIPISPCICNRISPCVYCTNFSMKSCACFARTCDPNSLASRRTTHGRWSLLKGTFCCWWSLYTTPFNIVRHHTWPPLQCGCPRDIVRIATYHGNPRYRPPSLWEWMHTMHTHSSHTQYMHTVLTCNTSTHWSSIAYNHSHIT